MRTVRRATKIVLALEAWKLEHGKLPETLDELVGTYFDKLPTPPRIDAVFAYFPEGLPNTLWAFPPGAGNYEPYEHAPFGPKKPLLLVCCGCYQKTGGGEVVAGHHPHMPKDNRVRSSEDRINDSFAFPIPYIP